MIIFKLKCRLLLMWMTVIIAFLVSCSLGQQQQQRQRQPEQPQQRPPEQQQPQQRQTSKKPQQQLRSPCPKILTIDPSNQTVDTWYGLLHLNTNNVVLHGVFVDLIFDRTVQQVTTNFYEASTTDNFEFRIEDRSMTLEPGDHIELGFYVRFVSNQGVPQISQIRLNGQNICVIKSGSSDPTIQPTVTTRGNSIRRSSGSNEYSPEYYDTNRDLTSTTTFRIPPGIFTSEPTTTTERYFVRTTEDNYGVTQRTTTKSPYFQGDLSYLTSKPKISEDKIPPLDTCGTIIPKANPLIVAGEETYRGQFPWHAAIYASTIGELKYICGGSLISKHAILTAAHCVALERSRRTVNPENLLIYLQKYNLRKWLGPEVDVKVSDILLHPKYDNERFYADIAIVKFRAEIQIGDYIRPVCLWNFGDDLGKVVESVGIVPGWGYNEHGLVSDELSYAKMPIVSHETCIWSNREFFSRVTSDLSFCAGYRNGTSVCNGDSGGGLVLRNGNKWHLRGIVSLSIALQNQNICDPHHYAVFTDVTKFIPWIKENL